jgi:protein-disulfide isomerase
MLFARQKDVCATRLIVIAAAMVVGLNIAHASGQSATAAANLRVLATVDGIPIYNSDIEHWWMVNDPSSFAQVQQQLYDGSKRALDAVIGEMLLAREAARRRMTVEQLLASEVAARAEPVTEQELQDMYSQAAAPGASFDELKTVILDYIRGQHVERAREKYLLELRKPASHAVNVELVDPREHVYVRADDPIRGTREAPVTIVEFADFQCPYCKELEPVLRTLRDKYGDKVRIVWRDFPLSIHPDASEAASAAKCADDQGQFWRYHDVLFAHQENLGPDELAKYAAESGIDVPTFIQCMKSNAHEAETKSAVEEGIREGIEATPTLVINDQMVVGARDLSVYEDIIDRELAARGKGDVKAP